MGRVCRWRPPISPASAAACVIAPIFAAPSSIEYSLCTCRCTKESDATRRVYGGPPTPRLRAMATPDFVVSLRERIGHAPLPLVGVTAVIVRGDEVLVGRRADNGAWQCVSGIVDPGEHPASLFAAGVTLDA